MRPGTCAQNMSSPNYDHFHVLVIDLHNYAHNTCIDDSEDVWCGDAKWQPDLNVVFDNREICDDGNNVSGDGCSSDCKTIEPYWTCVNGVYDKTNCTYVACGNGIYDAASVPKGVAVSEACDDGNTVNGDGCSSTCTIEPYSDCDGYGAGTCAVLCRNGNVDNKPFLPAYPLQPAYSEKCDEGVGRLDALGCSNDC